jgi:hypothetical protein
VRFLVVRSNEFGAWSHPQPSLSDAVSLASDFLADDGAGHVSIIDSKSLAIFRAEEIVQFAQRNHLSGKQAGAAPGNA